MKLSKLIEKCGDDVVMFQPLDICLQKADYGNRAGTKITFVTDQPLLPDGTRDYGLIVWLPRDKLKDVLAEAEKEGE